MEKKQKTEEIPAAFVFMTTTSKIGKNMRLKYYAIFKARKFESLFYKIKTCLQKTTTCIELQAEKIFSVNVKYTNFFKFWRGFCSFFSVLMPKDPASSSKKNLN